MDSQNNSFHENLNRQSALKLGKDKNFGFVFSFVFFTLFAVHYFREGQIKSIPLALSILFLAVSLALPQLLRPLNKLWAQFGLLMQKIISPLILAFLYFFIFTPIGLVLRVLKKDVLNLRQSADEKTYWIESDKRALNMKEQF